MVDDLDALRRALDAATGPRRPFSRAVVVARCGSTQDEARAIGEPDVLVVAGRQTRGRGRHGRAWADTAHQGLAATFCVDASAIPDAALAIGAGLAALDACDAALARAGEVGVRWPNDVVARDGRKVAGVLVERAGTLALVGIGINVNQGAGDWAPDLRAASLRELGSAWDRAAVAAALVGALGSRLRVPLDELSSAWRRRDVLVGTRRVFIHDRKRHAGLVESIDPAGSIVLALNDGSRVALPAITTSLAHDGEA